MWQCDGEKDRKVRIFYVKEHKGEMNFVILSVNYRNPKKCKQ